MKVYSGEKVARPSTQAFELPSAFAAVAHPIMPTLKKRARPDADATAVNCRTHNDEARKPAATEKKIALTRARTVRQKWPRVIPPINISSASSGKIANNPYAAASALEHSFPPIISGPFKLVRNNSPMV